MWHDWAIVGFWFDVSIRIASLVIEKRQGEAELVWWMKWCAWKSNANIQHLWRIQNTHATLFHRQLGKTNDSSVGSCDRRTERVLEFLSVCSIQSTELCESDFLSVYLLSHTHTHSWSDKDTVITAVTAERPTHYISVSRNPRDRSATTCLSYWNAHLCSLRDEHHRRNPQHLKQLVQRRLTIRG